MHIAIPIVGVVLLLMIALPYTQPVVEEQDHNDNFKPTADPVQDLLDYRPNQPSPVDLQNGQFIEAGREVDETPSSSSLAKSCQLIRSSRLEDTSMFKARLDQQGDTNGQTLHRLLKLHLDIHHH
jgi:hypothetical protein